MAEAALSELKEADAYGPIADIYSEIRTSLRVPMVNLIFRHMATIPGCLEWVWVNLRPLYISGLVIDMGQRLTTEQHVPALSIETADLQTLGLDPQALHSIIQTCDSYAQANPANLLGLKVLSLILHDTAQGGDHRHHAPGLQKQAPAKPAIALPPMGDLKTLPPDILMLLQDLARQVHGEDGPVIPSFYRHFTAWPAFLHLLYARLAHVMAAVNESAGAFEKAAETASRGIYADGLIAPGALPSQEAVVTLKALIGRFPPNLCKMTLVAKAIRDALHAQLKA